MRRVRRGRIAASVFTVVLAVVVAFVAFAGPACDDPSVGAAGIGDPYFPSAGNGGYDALSYEIALSVDPRSAALSGSTTIQAQALQDLESFNLDLLGLEVGSVHVNGLVAEFEREGQELTIVPPERLQAGEKFATQVLYSGSPTSLEDPGSFSVGWQHAGDTIYTLDEPQGAATWFPVNDHPSDKAAYVFHLTVPKPYVAAANGLLVGTEDGERDQTFVWEMAQPMASYLATVAIGEYYLEESSTPGGVPMRNYFAPSLTEAAGRAFARTGEILDFYGELFGPYPFAAYGVVVPDVDTGAAMENQTLSLFGRDVLESRLSEPVVGEIYISHELAHQWFGNSVTIASWEDVWLNEGFATYASWLWLEHDRGSEVLEEQVRQSLGMLLEDGGRPPGDPGPDDLFSVSVYRRGALTLHALRRTMGEESFFRLLREWNTRYRYGNVRTEDFIALAKEESQRSAGVDLGDLFEAWLYSETLPEMPAGAGAPVSSEPTS